MNRTELASMIDQTNLKPGVTTAEIAAFCKDAAENGFASVCILPVHIPTAAAVLRGTKTKVCTVISFPLGMDDPEVKLFESQDAIAKGAEELDVVVNVGAVKAGDRETVFGELAAICKLAHAHKAIVKVIIEMPLLTEEQSEQAARWAEEAGADIVKTSTGFKGLKIRSTVPGDIKLLKRVVKPGTGLKAAGGVRTTADALAMIREGATRIGASAGAAIVGGLE